MAALGVQVGERVTRAVIVEGRGRRCRFVAEAEWPTPVGAVVQGEVVQLEAVERLLKDIARRLRFKRGTVVAALDPRVVLVRIADVPPLRRRDLAEAVRLNLDRYLPLPRQEAIYQTYVRPTGVGRRREVVLVACRRETSERYLAAFEQAGLRLDVLDVAPLCLLRAVRRAEPLPEESFLLADLAGEVPFLTIFQEGQVPVLTRMVGEGEEWLTEMERTIRFFLLHSRQQALKEVFLLAEDLPEERLAALRAQLTALGLTQVHQVDQTRLECRAAAAVAFGAALRGCRA